MATASVSFTAPFNDGGTVITGYTVSVYEGNATVATATTSGSVSPITVNGLLDDTNYHFTVHATNAVGDSIESDVSNVIHTPPAFTVPDAPTNVVAV